jgi:hypothetical protein
MQRRSIANCSPERVVANAVTDRFGVQWAINSRTPR